MSRLIRTGPAQKPPPHFFYGDSYTRGLDPWHVDAAPPEFKKSGAFASGNRRKGWFLEDAWGNAVEFIPDGAEFELLDLPPGLS